MLLSMMHYDPSRDFDSVYRLFTDPDVNPLIIYRPDHYDIVSFRKWMEESLCTAMNDFMVFYYEKAFVGIAHSYQFQPMDGHCRFTIAVDAELQSAGFGVTMCVQFMEHLFVNYPLRKVYFHVYGYNGSSLASIRALVREEECILREHHYFDGEYYDVYVYAVTRQQYKELLTEYYR